MTKLTFTDMGELIVFRVRWDDEFNDLPSVYPTHRKALNALNRLPDQYRTEACVEPVLVFPGKTDRERIALAQRVLADPYSRPIDVWTAKRIIAACSRPDDTCGAAKGLDG